MTGKSRKRPAAAKRPPRSRQEKKHLDELLDEGLKETFPASDPPAILEPVPDSPQSEDDGGK
jgi:hypothetical protein